LLEAFQQPHARIVAGENARRMDDLVENVHELRKKAIGALRKRLHDEVIPVTVDDERRNEIAFAVHEPVRGRIDSKALTEAVRKPTGPHHAGCPLTPHFQTTLTALGHQVEDFGTHSEASVNYPPICAAVGRAVVEGRADRGIVLGGSGQGEQIAANKVRGIRAALCNDLYTARLSRQHNNANVLSIGGRIVAFGLADEILELWLKTEYEGGRHQRRLDQIAAQEKRA